MERIDRDELFMEIALSISKRATCERGSNGCVITLDHRIVSSGYNGPLKGLLHCGIACDKTKSCVRSVHAEANAIYAAAKNGIKLDGGVIYSTSRPCEKCLQAIASVGIHTVYFKFKYQTDGRDEDEVAELFDEAGVELIQL